MTIQKRIMLASALSVIVSALLIVSLWAGYEHFNKRIIVYPVRRASDGGDRLTETINVLYTFEVELFEMNRTAASASGGHGETLVLEPDRARIEELDDLGYHFGVETEGSEAFLFFFSEDMIFLSEVSDAVSEGVFWSEKGLLIRNDIVVMEHPCHITCVYNRERADPRVVRKRLAYRNDAAIHKLGGKSEENTDC